MKCDDGALLYEMLTDIDGIDAGRIDRKATADFYRMHVSGCAVCNADARAAAVSPDAAGMTPRAGDAGEEVG